MGVDRSFFELCNAAGYEVGQRVSFVQNPDRILHALEHGKAQDWGSEGEGTITLIWFGLAEVVDVETDDGLKVHLHPELGDVIEILPPLTASERTT